MRNPFTVFRNRILRSVIWRLPPKLYQRPRLLAAIRCYISGAKQIVVIGGHGGSAFDDNSRAVAIHYAADPGYQVFWIYQTADVRRKARQQGITPIKRQSLRAEFLLTFAHIALYSHGFDDLAPSNTAAHRSFPWRTIVYLGHGVWGLKRIERRSSTEGRKQFDMAVCVSDRERDLKSSVLQTERVKVRPVGLPKHDALLRLRDSDTDSSKEKRLVVYSPTWRDWIQHKPSDRAVELHLSAIKSLAEAMPETDGEGVPFEVIYLLHKNIRGIKRAASKICSESGFKCRSSKDVDVNKLLQSADYLITDYSALFWDFIVQGKAAARFLFDEPIYHALVGVYDDVAEAAEPLTKNDASDVWKVLFSPTAAEASRLIAQHVMPFSDGRSCERLEREVDIFVKRKMHRYESAAALRGSNGSECELTTISKL